MKKIYCLILMVGVFCTTIHAQKSRVALNTKYMMSGGVYAKSSIIDSTALGGFAQSNYAAKSMENDSLLLEQKGAFVFIDTAALIAIGKKYVGYKLYIGNNLGRIVGFSASDSRLSLVAEVYYQNKWQPIEYLSSSWCGNSYHTVYLKNKEYWDFSIVKYEGQNKTKLRYKLSTEDGMVYSNEINASFNRSQLSRKKSSNGGNNIMNPYR